MKTTSCLPVAPKLSSTGTPALAQVSYQQTESGPVALTFQASAPGLNYGIKGKEDAPVAIYLNGKYFSTEVILAEKGDAQGVGTYTVNFGNLPKGNYSIEIRPQVQLTPNASRAIVKAGSAKVGGYGDALSAQLARYEPIYQTRRPDHSLLGIGSSDNSDHRATITHTDIPLVLRGRVIGDPEGVHALLYNLTMSDEDDGTPDAKRMKQYHRTTDDEWLYEVLVDKDGNRLSPEQLAALKASGGAGLSPAAASELKKMRTPEIYQYGTDGGVQTHHQLRDFSGLKDGDRPILRDNSMNNNFAQLSSKDVIDTPLWSPTVDFDPSKVVRDAAGNVTTISQQSDLDIIHAFNWIQPLSAAEVAREPKDTSFAREVNAALAGIPLGYALLVEKIKKLLGIQSASQP